MRLQDIYVISHIHLIHRNEDKICMYDCIISIDNVLKQCSYISYNVHNTIDSFKLCEKILTRLRCRGFFSLVVAYFHDALVSNQNKQPGFL